MHPAVAVDDAVAGVVGHARRAHVVLAADLVLSTPGISAGSASSQSRMRARPMSCSAMCAPKAMTAVRMVWTSSSDRRQSSATRRRPKASRASPRRTRLSGFSACSWAMRSTPVWPGGTRHGRCAASAKVGDGLAHALVQQDGELAGGTGRGRARAGLSGSSQFGSSRMPKLSTSCSSMKVSVGA